MSSGTSYDIDALEDLGKYPQVAWMQMGVDLKNSYIFSLFSPRQACHDNAYLHSCLQSCFCATGAANNVCVQTVEFTRDPEEYFRSLWNYQSNSPWSKQCSSPCSYNHMSRTWEECLSIQKWISNKLVMSIHSIRLKKKNKSHSSSYTAQRLKHYWHTQN